MATTHGQEAQVDVFAAYAMRARPSRLKSVVRFCRLQPIAAFAAFVIIVMIILAVFAPYIAPYDPLMTHKGQRLVAPSFQFLLGTDHAARDVLSRVIFGARISLWVGIVSVGLGTFGGAIIGLISGYFEGKTDIIIQRVMDSIMAFPALILALTIMSILGRDLNNVLIAIAIVIAPGDSRIVRGAVLSAKQNQYVEAARCIGASHFRIVARHILPNVTAPIMVVSTVMLGSAILIEASLSFLGLGTPPPTPSWGGMLSAEGRYFMEKAPWLAWSPGIAITFAVFAFNMFGDALRDIWDPRLRGTK